MKKINTDSNLSYTLSQLQEKIFNNINCIKIGKIETFYKEDKTADISICFKKNIYINNKETKEDYSLLLKCPVLGNHITYPIKKGEYCIVLFNDINLDSWFENSDNQVPYTNETHNIADGIAIVGLNNLINKINDYDLDNIHLRNNTRITGDLLVEKNINVNININVKGNIEGATYSTNGEKGASGTFICQESGHGIKYKNGIIVENI